MYKPVGLFAPTGLMVFESILQLFYLTAKGMCRNNIVGRGLGSRRIANIGTLKQIYLVGYSKS